MGDDRNYGDGSVKQSSHDFNSGDYEYTRIYFPVVGIVLRVHYSDDTANITAKDKSDQRGSGVTADVLVIKHENDDPFPVQNVVVLPSGPSGVDDFCEDIPRPCTQLIDGTAYDNRFNNDFEKLDGDYCVVSFIGGDITQPIMIGWWPHPSNRTDPATNKEDVLDGTSNNYVAGSTLKQGRRSFRRYAGTKFTVTSQGSVFVDTNESNAFVEGSKSGLQRKPRDKGGDVQLDIKKTRRMQVNFNPPVPLPNTEPSVPQPNPPKGEKQRSTDLTAMTFDKDVIEMIAGEVVKLITNNANIEIHAKTKVTAVGDDGDDSVILGSDVPGDCDHAVKGETFMSLYNKLVYAFNNHTHLTSVGPTDIPTVAPNPLGSVPADDMTDNELSQPVMVVK